MLIYDISTYNIRMNAMSGPVEFVSRGFGGSSPERLAPAFAAQRRSMAAGWRRGGTPPELADAPR